MVYQLLPPFARCIYNFSLNYLQIHCNTTFKLYCSNFSFLNCAKSCFEIETKFDKENTIE